MSWPNLKQSIGDAGSNGITATSAAVNCSAPPSGGVAFASAPNTARTKPRDDLGAGPRGSIPKPTLRAP